jgi:hypothetical protein
MEQELDPQLHPLFLQVIQSQKKCILMEQSMMINSNCNSNNFNSDTYRNEDTLWKQIQYQTEATQFKSYYDQKQEYESNLERFLQELTKGFNKRQERKNNNNDHHHNEDDAIGTNPNAMACFYYIMDILSHNDTSFLLQQHSVLRILPSIIEQDRMVEIQFIRHLKTFVDAIGNLSTTTSSSNTSTNTTITTPRSNSLTVQENNNAKGYNCILHMQQDAVRIMKDMVDRYTTTSSSSTNATANACNNTKVSKLIIAYRYLSEQKGISLLLDTNTTTSSSSNSGTPQTNGEMMNARRKRDQAIQYGEKECRKLNQVLYMVQECIDILVPRFGHDSSLSVGRTLVDRKQNHASNETILVPDDDHNSSYNDKDIHDDDDDDIEWEDGDDIRIVSQSTMSYEHMNSVEQTLAVMEQSGSLQHGAIHVELDTQDFSAHVNDNKRLTANDHVQDIKDKLKKCANVLKKRLQVLNDWYHALITSDNMIESNRLKRGNEHSSSSGGSLVLLPLLLRQKKGKVLHLIHRMKVDVTQALSTIDRLKHLDHDGKSTDLEEGPDASTSKTNVPSTIASDKMSTQSWVSGLNRSHPAEDTKNRLELKWKTNQTVKRKPKSRVQIKLRRT